MKLLNADEYAAYVNYEKDNTPLIELIILACNEQLNLKHTDDKLLFVMQGGLYFSLGNYQNKQITEKEALMIPASYAFMGVALPGGCRVVIIRLSQITPLCDGFSLGNLMESAPANYTHTLTYLSLNDILCNYLEQLVLCINQGLYSSRFLNLKVDELFLLLWAFYTKENLLDFFYLQLTGDLSFSRLVHKHFLNARNAQELANLLNYSYSGFIKRFNKVFLCSPYRWMKGRKAELILHEIKYSEKSLLEISNEYGFCSQGRFCDFCKQEFGLSPSEIRKNKKNGNNTENLGKNT